MINSIKNSEHYVMGINCEGWHVHKSKNLSVIQKSMPCDTSE